MLLLGWAVVLSISSPAHALEGGLIFILLPGCTQVASTPGERDANSATHSKTFKGMPESSR